MSYCIALVAIFQSTTPLSQRINQIFKLLFGLSPFTDQPFCGLKDNLHSVWIDSCSVSSRSRFGIRCSCGRSCPDPQQSLLEINGLLGISVPAQSAVRWSQDNVCKVTLSDILLSCCHLAGTQVDSSRVKDERFAHWIQECVEWRVRYKSLYTL